MWDAVGLGAPEGRAYEALIEHRQSTIEELASAIGLTRAQARRIAERLVQIGLATRLPGTPARYAATPPDLAASELLAAQERRQRTLQSHLQQLARTYAAGGRTQHPAELIEVIEGAQNVRSTFRRIQREATQELRVFDRPPYFNLGGGDTFEVNEQELDSLDHSHVRYRVIYERSVLEMPGRMADIWAGIRHGERARVAASLPLKLALADDRAALVNSTSDFGEATAYLVHPSAILDALIEVFESIWGRSVALNQAPPASSATSGTEPTDGSRDQLIGLLAGGATDDAIARACGISARTVQRHIHALMSQLGAATRIQLGMELVRRDLV